jgi:hypothetical protein
MKVKDLLADASKWTRGASARDRSGKQCSIYSPDAVRYCLLGALLAAYDGEQLAAAVDAVRQAIGDEGQMSIESWNDDHGRTFDEVRRVIELADAAAEAAGEESVS